MTNPVSQIYARVENGQIIEYPVYLEFIVARGDPIDLYTPISPSNIPQITPYQQLSSVPSVVGNQVFLSYTVENMPLESLLALAWGVPTYEDIATATVVPTISSIPPALVSAIEEEATNLVQNILDNFAASKGYSNIASAASYYNSTIPEFAQDAAAAVYCRDSTWSSLYTYMDEMLAGTIPVLSSFDSVLSILPVHSWGPPPTYSGPTTIIPGTTNTYTITNYRAGAYYQATATYGIASISGNTVTLNAGTPGSDTLYINNLAIPITIAYPAPIISGSTSVAVNSTTQYTVTNYYAADTYSVSATSGTVSISGDTITYVAPGTSGSATITCNGTTINVTFA